MSDILRLSVLSRQAGMSYGQYVAIHTTGRERSARKEPEKAGLIEFRCTVCDKVFDYPESKRRKYCDECADNQRKTRNRETKVRMRIQKAIQKTG